MGASSPYQVTPHDASFVEHRPARRPVSQVLVNAIWHDSLQRVPPYRDIASKDAEAFEKARRKKKSDPVMAFDIPLRPEGPDPAEQNGHAIVFRLQAWSDSTGVYRICGVPKRGYDLRIIAQADTLESDSLDARADLGMHRRDLRLPVTTGAKQGTVGGQLTDRSGAPVPYARQHTGRGRVAVG